MSENQTPVPKDSPLMIAWEAYKATPEYANTFKWATTPRLEEGSGWQKFTYPHTEGSLWACFRDGFASGRVPAQAAAPPSEPKPRADGQPHDCPVCHNGPEDVEFKVIGCNWFECGECGCTFDEDRRDPDEIPWRCYHCGLVCYTYEEANDHFGPTQHHKPTCQAAAPEGWVLVPRELTGDMANAGLLNHTMTVTEEGGTLRATLTKTGLKQCWSAMLAAATPKEGQ